MASKFVLVTQRILYTGPIGHLAKIIWTLWTLSIWTSIWRSKCPIGQNFQHCSIPTNCPFPSTQRAYHYPPHYNDFIKEEIERMLENGIIRESTSSWASPIVVVKKKNNKLRFCVDYRKVNACTEQDKYPLPLIADIFDSLEGSKYFSSLDLASGYWQMEVAEEDKKKTAFISKHGLYEFNRMPFGLTNAPASFQRLMNKVLKNENGKFVVVYLDDINIYSKSFEEHLEHLEIVFSH